MTWAGHTVAETNQMTRHIEITIQWQEVSVFFIIIRDFW